MGMVGGGLIVTLTGANLTGADLTLAYLPGANLSGADLTSAHLLSTNLTGAILNSANFTNANLYGSDFTGAQVGNGFTGVGHLIYSNTTCPDSTNSNNNAGTCRFRGGGL